MLDLRAELLASGDDAIELAGQFGDECGGRVSPRDGRRLGARGVEEALSEEVGALRPPGLQARRDPLGPGSGQRRAARIFLQQRQDRPGVQPLAEPPFEGRPVRAQEGAQPVRQAVGIGAEVGVVAAQQLQPRPCLVGRLQPDDPTRVSPRHVGQDERVLRVGLALAGIEVARPRHRRPVQVADRHAGGPAQAQQQRRRAAGLVDDERRLALGRPADQIAKTGLVVFYRPSMDDLPVLVDAHGVVGRLPDVHSHVDAWRHPALPTPCSNRRCPPRIHVTRATTARPYPATVAHRACSGATPPGPSTAGGIGHAEHAGPVSRAYPLNSRKER